MEIETENFEKAAKGFENTRSWFAIFVVGTSSEVLPVAYLKGRYKCKSSLMTCEAEAAELHGWVSSMQCPMLSHIGIYHISGISHVLFCQSIETFGPIPVIYTKYCKYSEKHGKS